jgi:ribosome-binding ATPase
LRLPVAGIPTFACCVIAYDDFIALGSEVAAKKAGKYRLEGREYVVQDGDIMHFRFNV